MPGTLKKLYVVFGLAVAIASTLHAQDAVPISRANRSILQPEMEAQTETASGFTPADHVTSDWLGYRERLFRSGVEVFAFYNSIYNGNVSGGIHPGHATYVDDAWLGFKFDLQNWSAGKADSLSSAESIARATISPENMSAAFIRCSSRSAGSGRFFTRFICSKSFSKIRSH